MILYQSTLKGTVSFNGIGVHSGENSRISVSPAEEDHGIVFFESGESIAASFRNVSETTMRTKLSSILTIEHLLAALYGLGITNALIRVEGGEIPILDGSAIEFVDAFLSVGIKTQNKRLKYLKVLKTIKVQMGEKWESLSPANSLIINVACDFTANGLKTNLVRFNLSENDFIHEIAPARTFGFLGDEELLRKNNLAVGASLKNTVVFDDKGCPINEGGLRLKDEPIRHKILDVIGDLSLSGYRLLSEFDSFCPSHKMNNMVLQALFNEKDNYEIIDNEN